MRKLLPTLKRFSKQFIIFLLVLGLFTGAVMKFWTKEASAAWFDDSYAYRTALTFTHNANDTYKKVKFDIDTAALISAGKMQSDCGDSRFTDAKGKVLKYYIDTSGGACNTNSTDYYVLMPVIVNGSNLLYHYYGNPSVVNGTEAAQFSQATLSPSGGAASTASEEKGPTPSVSWKMDEGTGSTLNDSTANRNSGVLPGSTATPAWLTGSSCISGSCLKFDGTDDYASSSATINLTSTNAVTVEFWMNWKAYANDDTVALEFSQNYNNREDGFAIIPNASGGNFSISLKGNVGYNIVEFTRPTPGWHHYAFVLDKSQTGSNEIVPYVDGIPVTRTLTSSNNNTNNFGNLVLNLMGRAGTSNFGGGVMDEVKIYPFSRTAAQIKGSFVARGNEGGAALGANTNSAGPGGLSYGITHYYKFDEASWTNDCSTKSVKDSAGNADLKSCPNAAGISTPSAGKYGNAPDFDDSNDELKTDFNENYGKRWAVSAWYKTTDTQGYLFDTRDADGGSGNYGIAVFTDGANTFSFYQVNNSVTTKSYYYTSATLDNNWHQLVVTRDGDNTISFYVDKVKLSTASVTTDVDISAINDVWEGIHVGNRFAGNTYPQSGLIDEVRMYSRAFSQDDVNKVYDFAPGPVGYWKMDEKSGQNVVDSSGNSSTGTFGDSTSTESIDPTWGTGKYGGGVVFNGSHYVNVPHSSSINVGATTDSYTFMTWTRIDAMSGGFAFPRIMQKGQAAFGSGQLPFAITGIDSSGTPYVSCSIGDGTNFPGAGGSSVSGAAVMYGKWVHVACVRDVTADKIRLYINGKFIDEGTDTTTATTQNASLPLRFGCFPGGGCAGGGAFKGATDEAKLYNYARTAKQIIEDMNGGHPAGGSPVGSQVSYWDMDEGYGTTAHDRTLNKNDLTLSTASWTNSGKIGKAFDGADNKRLSRSDDDDLDFTASEDMSLSLWFKSDSATNPSAAQYLLDKLPSGASNGGYAIYSSSSSDGLICFGIDDDNTSFPEDSVCSTTDLYDTNWHHVVARKTGSSRLDLYVDGKSVGTPDTSISASVNTLANSSTFYLGDANGTDGSDEFLGDVDEVKIYRSALTESELAIDLNRNASQVLGSSGNNSTYAAGAANQEYCVPGDSTSCAAPVGEWKFNEGSGSTVNDTSGNANTGTWNGTLGRQWTTGKMGKAGNFNGTNNHISAGTGSSLETQQITIESWFKTTSSAQGGIVQKSNRWFNLYIGQLVPTGTGCGTDAAGKVTFLIMTGAATNACAHSSGTYNDGIWHFAVGTYDGSSLKLYIDGKLVTTTSVSQALGNGSGNFSIGYDGVGYFNGSIDGVKEFNYARTAAQVAWDYNKGAPIAHWDMDECQGATLYDRSSSLNATLTVGGSGTQTSIGSCQASGTARGNGANSKVNNSVNFDGVDDYATIGSTLTNFSSAVTLSAWIKPSSTASPGEIISKGDAANFYRMKLSGSALVFDTYGPSNSSLASNTNLTNGIWTHVVMVYDGATKKIYINGKLDASVSATGAMNTGGVSTMYIGGYGFGSGEYFPGSIDELQVYGYPLTETQVKNLYNGGAVRFGPSSGTP